MALRGRTMPAALGALAAVALMAGACSGSGGGASHASSPSASGSMQAKPGSTSANPVIGFDMRGGTAFAWSERVRGTARCRDVTLSVNGRPSTADARTEGSSFHLDLPLRPGRDTVVASCTTSGGSVEKSTPLVWNERLQARPTARIRVSVESNVVTLDASHSGPTQPFGSRVARYAWSRDVRHPAKLELASGKPFSGHETGPTLKLRAPSRDGEYYVSLTVSDAKGRADRSTVYFVVAGGRAHAVDRARQHPSWIDSAVIYAPIPILWGNGGPRAIERRLPYLKKLGVDALWLWPPTEQRAFGEEYRITDYFKLDPEWGPPAAFKHMVDRAHALGMHVMIDFVPNHTSTRHPYFLDQKKYGKASHYYDFYDRDAKGRITEYTQIFGTIGLPNLNYGNPEVRRMIIEASLSWIRTYGIDGFRVDAAWGVQRRDPAFWAQWRRALTRVDPDLLLLGEASATDAHIFRGFDVAYDWSGQPGYWAWKGAFDFPQEIQSLLTEDIDPKAYAPDALIMRFLNNNDTDIRFVDQYGADFTRVAATLQFTLPGIPEMFAGDEIGLSYTPYSNLTPMQWQDRYHLRGFYERLIDIKHREAALNTHEVDLQTSSPDSSFVYVRPAAGGSGRAVMVVLNFGDRAKVTIPRTPAVEAVLGSSGGAMHDLLTGDPVKLTVKAKAVSHQMDKESALVLVSGGR